MLSQPDRLDCRRARIECLDRELREPAIKVSSHLRSLWKNLPDDMIPKAQPPRRLTQADLEENYEYKDLDCDVQACKLILRVSAGVKPFATILLRCPYRVRLPFKTFVDAVHKLDLHQNVFYTRLGRRTAVVYQGLSTLGQYYDADEVIARYAAEGIKLERSLFELPLGRLVRNVAFEQFPEEINLPMLGLCFGYPVNETIDRIQTERNSRGASSART